MPRHGTILQILHGEEVRWPPPSEESRHAQPQIDLTIWMLGCMVVKGREDFLISQISGLGKVKKKFETAPNNFQVWPKTLPISTG